MRTKPLSPAAPGAPPSPFEAAVLEGLGRREKAIPPRFFYDAAGSALFEEITQLPEYYPTRTETAILADHAEAMAEGIGPGAALIEFGAGSSRKTELLLAALPEDLTYVPIDISESALADAAGRLRRRFPRLQVHPLTEDFTGAFRLPPSIAARPKLGFFPGSTIGNFEPDAARRLLAGFGAVLGAGARLIIGVDLVKDAQLLVSAYDDAAGVTAAFNKNLLVRINRELGGSFDLAMFRHRAVFDPKASRIEMHLVARADHAVAVAGRRFAFTAGETIHTENSYKYTPASFLALAAAAGLAPLRQWTDARGFFAVFELLV